MVGYEQARSDFDFLAILCGAQLIIAVRGEGRLTIAKASQQGKGCEENLKVHDD